MATGASMNSSKSSGLLSADGVVMNQPGKLTAVTISADGTNAATVLLYDNASAASGNLLAKVVVDAGLTYEALCFDAPIDALNGIYLDITGTGAECIVYYQAG